MVSNQVGEQNEDWKKLITSRISLFPRQQPSLLCCCTLAKSHLISKTTFLYVVKEAGTEIG